MHTADFSQHFPNTDPLCQNCHTQNSDDAQMTAVSYVCIDCHNGVMTETVRHVHYDPSPGAPNLAQHPIFVNYLNGGSSSLKPLETPLDGKWEDAEKIKDLLENNILLCTSCHVPHTGALKAASGFSALCQGCHTK